MLCAIKRVLHWKALRLSLASLLCVGGLLLFFQPLAVAVPEQPLNKPSRSEAAVDRAYTIRQGVGVREEDRQAKNQELPPLDPEQKEAIRRKNAKVIPQIKDLQGSNREAAYEKGREAINNPKGLDEIYEDDLQTYKEVQAE